MEEVTAAAGEAERTALFNRDFFLLWQGQLVSQLGNQAFSVAMIYWLMEATGSASLMGLIMMVSLLPGVLIGPFGGALADRHSRRGIIVISDLLRGLAVSALAGAMFLRPGSSHLVIAMLFGVGLFSGIITAVFQPAITAAIPDLVPRDRVAAGNSLTMFSVQASTLVGQAAGGLLYAAVGAALLFLIDGLTYLFSALSEAFIRIPHARPAEAPPAGRAIGGYARDTVAGIRYVWGRPGMRAFLLVTSAVNFLAMPVIILLPFYVTERLLRGPAWYGLLLAAFGGGSLAGYVVAGTANIPPHRRPWAVTSFFVVMGSLLAGLGFVHMPVAALGLLFIVGLCTGAINIFVITLFQAATPSAMRGRVMALVLAFAGAAMPLGMALGGWVGDATDKNIPLLYLVCGALIGLLVLGASRRAAFRDFLAWDASGAG